MRRWLMLAYVVCGPILQFLFHIRAEGMEKLPEGAVLLCANHSAYTDPMFVGYLIFPRYNPRFVGKEELRHVPVLGRVLENMGVIFLRRGKSDLKAIREILRSLKDGEKVLIFPEGTRVKGDEYGDARTGPAMLALRTGAPLMPVYIPSRKRVFRRNIVIFGEPYHPQRTPERAAQEDYESIAEDLMARIRALEPKET
ncbi:MAG: 1-acyl-sn-glycerol-3-phosphate acyltransferase [Oscillospiraceae bacterium]|nr:1-acyl-sn-glycerol-3-phosphate acyltransferase [Oscillospiraceae bacterium]